MQQEMCMVCHDNPAENVERPAYNLYRQAVTESEIEFFARMLAGVRGDRVIDANANCSTTCAKCRSMWQS